MTLMRVLSFLVLAFSFSVQAIEFNDKQLKSYIEENETGLIYLWSPAMPLSEKGLLEAKKIAEKLDISFLPTTAPQALEFVKNINDYTGVFKESLKNPLTSYRLDKKGVHNHYPAMILFKDGVIITPIIHGYEQEKGLSQYIQQYLKREL